LFGVVLWREKTDVKPVTAIASAIFAVVACLHLLRIVLGWEVLIQGVVIPMWASYLGVLVPSVLSFLLWRESRP
jgi:hypothetical protein